MRNMEDSLKDIVIIVPAEFIEDFYKVIESGLERAKLTGDVMNNKNNDGFIYD